MWLRAGCNLTFQIEVPTPFILMLRARSGSQQWVAREEYKILPGVPVQEFADVYGNLCQRVLAEPGELSIHSSADVRVEEYFDEAPGAEFIEIQNLPYDVLGYLLPSRYCESDRFGEMATSITMGAKPGYDQVAIIENWLRDNIKYTPGDSLFQVSAVDVNQRQYGVCRDLAHLGIALCRSLSIPARMVVGYLYNLKPMDMHAWFEAYVGGRWYSFDAVHDGTRGGYVSVGYGRDAADVALYNQFGPPVFPLNQEVWVEHLPDGI